MRKIGKSENEMRKIGKSENEMGKSEIGIVWHRDKVRTFLPTKKVISREFT